MRLARWSLALVATLGMAGCPACGGRDDDDSGSTSSSGGGSSSGPVPGSSSASGTSGPGSSSAAPGSSSAGSGAASGSSGLTSSSAAGSSGSSGPPDAGAEEPAAACPVVTADGGVRTGPVMVDEAVTLSSAGFQLPGGENVTGRTWSVERMPPGATVAFTAPQGATTELWSQGRPGLVLAGGYLLRLDLQGAGGSSARSFCALEARARSAVNVELSWPTRSQDLDLHLLQVQADGGVESDSPADCSFANCQPQNPLRPSWGNPDAGTTNPMLSLESDQGYGPERIELQVPPPGQYVVAVQHFADHGAGPVDATVTIQLFGQTRLAWVSAPLSVGQRLDVARITVPADSSQATCVEDLVRGGSTCVTGSACTAYEPCPSCASGTACGPGLMCHASTGLCEPVLPGCAEDGDCSAPQVCQPATHSCVDAECDGQHACPLPAACQAGQLRCETLPPVCQDQDEPNNDPSHATALPASLHLAQAPLCRGDVDVLSFDVAEDGRAEVSVTLPAAQPGLQVRLLGADGASVLAEAMADADSLKLAGFYSGGTQGFLWLSLDNGAPVDQVVYGVTVVLTSMPACGLEPQEPNESVDAAAVVSAGTLAQAICTATDQDFFLFHAPAFRRVRFLLDAALPVTAEVLDGQGNPRVEATTGTSALLAWTTSAVPEDLVLHVSAAEGSATFPVPYLAQVEALEAPRCADSAQEPNDTPSTARGITASPLTGVACDDQDDDFYAFTLAQEADVDLVLEWEDTTADLDMVLLAADGMAVDAAASSDNPEVLAGMHLLAGDYLVRVQPVGLAAPVPYTLNLVGWP